MGEKEADPHHPAAPLGGLNVAKFLIDECLHTSLVQLAHAAGHAADQVTYIYRASGREGLAVDGHPHVHAQSDRRSEDLSRSREGL